MCGNQYITLIKGREIMRTEDIIRRHLRFLESDYGMIYTKTRKRGDTISYANENGRFEYYYWQQFQEFEFIVRLQQECKTIDMLTESPRELGEFYHKSKGLNRLFKDTRDEYWKIIANIIKKEIGKSGTLFGLKIG